MVKFSKFTFQKNKHIRVLSWSILSIIYHQTYVTNISSSSSRSLRLRHFFEMFEISRPEIDTSLQITSPSLLINRKNINISILKREESKREEYLAMILFDFRWFFDKLSFSNFRTRYSSQARSPRLLSSSSLNIFWVLSTRIMGRVDSVERNLEKRVFSTNFLVFFRERSRWERKRWYQLIWTYHKLILYNSHISMMLMTMHHMDWVIILMMSMDFVMLSTDHCFLDLGLGRTCSDR